MTDTASPSSYDEFARELVASNVLGDPWIYGRERFRLTPTVLDATTYGRLCDAAECIALAFDEAARIVWDRPQHLDDYFHLTPYQKLMWLASGGRWHGIARLDLFLLRDGSIQCCEMNSDTPSGEAEAVLLNRIRHRDYPELVDPNAGFEERFVALIETMDRAVRPEAATPPTVAIVYPTDLPEDLSMIALYRRWLEARGMRVLLGGPFNLTQRPDGIGLFDARIDVVIRHYKTDWWGERLPVWTDEREYEDPDPLDGPLRLLLDADAAATVAVVNPFGSVITQNKVMMAFLWDHLDELSESSARAVRMYIPETRRTVDVNLPDLDRREWVLKSDYGCEGDEVVIGPLVDDSAWSLALETIIPEHWIAQRYFDAAVDADLAITNHGVYLLGGLAAGIYARVSRLATDVTALSTPTFIAS